MEYQSLPHRRVILVAAFLLGSIGLAGILYVDRVFLETGPFREGLPDLSYGGLLRSSIILLSLVVIAYGFARGRRFRDARLTDSVTSFERFSVLGTFCLSSLFSLLFLAQPSVFSALSKENNLIESASALLLFGSSATFVLAMIKGRTQARIPMVTKAALVLLAAVFFVIAMEEISWFQHLLAFETPGAFAGNEQDELNFHNFATDKIENAYYFGAFLFLVVLPFLGAWFPASASDERLGPLLPKPFIALIGAVACAYNFDMWNIVFIQISFFGSLIVMSLLGMISNNRNERITVLFAALLLITTQAIFLTNGDNFARLWEVTEYKEFFIPLGFFAYSVSVYRTIMRSATLSDESHR